MTGAAVVSPHYTTTRGDTEEDQHGKATEENICSP